MPPITAMELPRYRSHKEVHALKIKAIEFVDDGAAWIVPIDSRYGDIKTPADYRTRFHGGKPLGDALDDLGYYVVYAYGYCSWSPSKAFEEGYRLVES